MKDDYIEKPVRYIIVNSTQYLRVEDVTALIREVGATEDTDVRNRLNKLAEQLEKSA
jgi:hypothetical protein